jgi:transposase
VRRLEVFTGSGRRRAWSVEQKARIIAESYETGETVSAIARRHGLTPQQLFGWRQVAQRRADDVTGAKGSAFAPVIVDAGPPCADVPIAPACAGGSPVIEIVIGAATVRIPPGTDAATLQTVPVTERPDLRVDLAQHDGRDIELYLECPWRYLYQIVLGLSDRGRTRGLPRPTQPSGSPTVDLTAHRQRLDRK